METNLIIFYLLFAHWIADFVCQTHEMAVNKSTSNKWLLIHVGVYTLIMFVFLLIALAYIRYNYDIYFNGYQLIIFVLVTFASHFVTDYITSREVSKYWAKEDYHNAFVVIGFDQLLHYVQLFLTLYFLFYA